MNQPTCECRLWVKPYNKYADQNKTSAYVIVKYNGYLVEIFSAREQFSEHSPRGEFMAMSLRYDFIPLLSLICRDMCVKQIVMNGTTLCADSTKELFQLLRSMAYLEVLHMECSMQLDKYIHEYNSCTNVYVNELVDFLPNVPRLNRVHLPYAWLAVTQCIRIANALVEHPTVSRVYIAHAVSYKGAISMCKIFSQSKRIRQIYFPVATNEFETTRFSDVVVAICEMISKSGLEVFKITNNHLQDSDVLAIGERIRAKLNFRELNIRSDGLSSRAIDLFSNVVGSEHPTFKYLMIRSSQIPDITSIRLSAKYYRYHEIRVKRLIVVLYGFGTRPGMKDVIRRLNDYFKS